MFSFHGLIIFKSRANLTDAKQKKYVNAILGKDILANSWLPSETKLFLRENYPSPKAWNYKLGNFPPSGPHGSLAVQRII